MKYLLNAIFFVASISALGASTERSKLYNGDKMMKSAGACIFTARSATNTYYSTLENYASKGGGHIIAVHTQGLPNFTNFLLSISDLPANTRLENFNCAEHLNKVFPQNLRNNNYTNSYIPCGPSWNGREGRAFPNPNIECKQFNSLRIIQDDNYRWYSDRIIDEKIEYVDYVSF